MLGEHASRLLVELGAVFWEFMTKSCSRLHRARNGTSRSLAAEGYGFSLANVIRSPNRFLKQLIVISFLLR